MNMNENRKSYDGIHYLGQGISFNTDTWQSGTNNNVLVIGPTGAGKTRNYVKPNVLNSHESMIILDSKGSLYGELAKVLEYQGYDVKLLDFRNLSNGCGYNPFDFIRYDKKKKRYSEEDILSLSNNIVSSLSNKDPYWDVAARQYLSCLISYTLEALPEEEHNLITVSKLLNIISTDLFEKMMYELSKEKPDSSAYLRYAHIREIRTAEKMDSSIKGILSTNLDPLCFDDAKELYKNPDKIDFAQFGKRKTVLFLTISDTDRSLDKLADAFMSQALQQLCLNADNSDDHRLKVPVRLYLDDFANTLFIPDFDKIISVIRSREISVSVILQSVSQLNSLYGEAVASTIINNCDKLLYLGGQDLCSADLISKRASRTIDSVLSMDPQEAWVFIRGQKAQKVNKYSDTKIDEDIACWQARIS